MISLPDVILIMLPILALVFNEISFVNQYHIEPTQLLDIDLTNSSKVHAPMPKIEVWNNCPVSSTINITKITTKTKHVELDYEDSISCNQEKKMCSPKRIFNRIVKSVNKQLESQISKQSPESTSQINKQTQESTSQISKQTPESTSRISKQTPQSTSLTQDYTKKTSAEIIKHTSSSTDTTKDKKMTPFKARVSLFPYQAAFLHKSKLFCGGSVIHPQLILTSASCLKNKDINEIKILAGIVSLNIHGHGVQSLPPSEVIMPPDYDPKTTGDHLAMVVVSQLVIDLFVGVIRCPENPPESFENCIETGWSSMISSSQNVDLRGRKTESKQIKVCQKKGSFADGVFCGEEISSENCVADRGAPLACSGVLYGVVSRSYASEENTNKHVEVYCDVYFHKDWIISAVKRQSVNLASNLEISSIMVFIAMFFFVIHCYIFE